MEPKYILGYEFGVLGLVYIYDFPRYSLVTPNVIQYVLNGISHSMSITEFYLQFEYLHVEDLHARWYQDTETVVPKWFSDNLDNYLREIFAMRAFRKGNNKDKELKDPALRICHRFLAVNLYARMDGKGNTLTPQG